MSPQLNDHPDRGKGRRLYGTSEDIEALFLPWSLTNGMVRRRLARDSPVGEVIDTSKSATDNVSARSNPSSTIKRTIACRLSLAIFKVL
jgi:hypothetical protein